MILNNSTIKFNEINLKEFFGNEISNQDAKKLNTIFQECNIEKNEKGEIDNVLSGNERVNFLSRIKNELSHLYQKVVDFSTTVEVSEDLEEMQQAKQNDME